jgi:hypothetical protein
MFWFALI